LVDAPQGGQNLEDALRPAPSIGQIFAALLVSPQLALAQFTQQGGAAPKLLRGAFTLGNREAAVAV
jgi:hypothetical protein